MPKRSDREHAEANIKNPSVRLFWKDFVWVLTNKYGAKMTKKRGSVRLFSIEGVYPFTADEPHGREPWVSKPDRERAKWAIEAFETLQGDDKENTP